MKTHQQTIGKNDEWLTPIWILDALGEFDLDPCAPVQRPWDTARHHYTVLDDGLRKPWIGRECGSIHLSIATTVQNGCEKWQNTGMG